MIKRMVRAAFHASGALGAARWANRKRLRILMYHRFRDRAELARQCEHICTHYTPVSMGQVAEWLLAAGGWPENALAITVDDGYRDFYQVAYPVFREHGIPATVYLVTDFLDRRLWLWVDRVRWAYLNSERVQGGREERLRAARTAIETAKRMANHERLAWIERVPDQLAVRIPEEAPVEYEGLRWDEVREAAANAIEFGAHTRSHPILSTLSGERELTDEIAGSKRRIEEELGRPVEHFCYPNGSARDINAATVQVVRESGFRTATTTDVGMVSAKADALHLRRIGVDPWLDERYFAECAAGIRR
jgi:peptidoglycan/xylan/chitin deacetylase (PgdA/CDA1 family)